MTPLNSTNVYETQGILSDYLLFHYGSEADILAYEGGPTDALDFPARCVTNLLSPPQSRGGATLFDLAYDLGCGVGRSSFELSAFAGKVEGYDLSASFINAANHLLRVGEIRRKILVEGGVNDMITLSPPPVRQGCDLSFAVGDAVNLVAELPPADVVLAANLLCRLPTPKRFLNGLPRLVRPGGQLLLVTPFTWLEEFTPRSAWPSDADGKPIRGAVWIKTILGPHFTLEHAEDMPFLIREHERKFQWTVAYGMRWRRTS